MIKQTQNHELIVTRQIFVKAEKRNVNMDNIGNLQTVKK